MPPYRQLLFKCENLSCLHVEECGQANLWVSYLRREELQKEHQFCSEGYLRIPIGRLKGQYGKIVAGPFGLEVYFALKDKLHSTRVVDPRLSRVILLLERTASLNYAFHSNMPFWDLQYDLGWRCGRASVFSRILSLLKNRKDIVSVVEKEIALRSSENSCHAAKFFDNYAIWKKQSREERDPGLLGSTYIQGMTDGCLHALHMLKRLISQKNEKKLWEAIHYAKELNAEVQKKIKAYGVQGWKPTWATLYKGPWHYPK